MNELKQRALKAISEANITAAISHMDKPMPEYLK